jgi:hypothetical protein
MAVLDGGAEVREKVDQQEWRGVQESGTVNGLGM